MKKLAYAGQDLPLGVHIHPDGVAVVDVRKRDGMPSVRAFHSDKITLVDGQTIKERQVEALKRCLEAIGGSGRTCVLSVLPTQVVSKRFELPNKVTEKAIRSAAEIEADHLSSWSPEERVLSIDALPGTTDRLLSVSRVDFVASLTDIARQAGLETVAVDVPLPAWQRSMRNDQTDALLDLTYQRPALYVFGDPIGDQILLAAAMNVESLAESVRSILIDLRTKRRIEVRSLRVVGDYLQAADLVELLKQDAGLEAKLLTIGDSENPAWAYAVALATWSFFSTKSGNK